MLLEGREAEADFGVRVSFILHVGNACNNMPSQIAGLNRSRADTVCVPNLCKLGYGTSAHVFTTRPLPSTDTFCALPLCFDRLLMSANCGMCSRYGGGTTHMLRRCATQYKAHSNTTARAPHLLDHAI